MRVNETREEPPSVRGTVLDGGLEEGEEEYEMRLCAGPKTKLHVRAG